jgi:phospholipase A1
MHQSNGKGGDLERSWNRVYAEAILANGGWSVLVQPWYIIKDSSLDNHNSDIAHYMGHGVAWVSYKVGQQVFSVMVRNELESGFSRGAEEITWSFPLTTHLKGYMLLFSGYGQSLIEYNHYTNSVGLGISISDWI